jgi:hypothetical protein
MGYNKEVLANLKEPTVSFALNALNLDDLRSEAIEQLHFCRYGLEVLLEIPQAQANALAPDTLLLAIDADKRRQLFALTRIEPSTRTEARLHLWPVYGVPVLNVQSLFRVPAQLLAPYLFDVSEALALDAQWPELRILMHDVCGKFRLESDQEERGLELVVSLLSKVRQEGMHPLLFDGYGVLKRNPSPDIHLVEVGRTHGFSVEEWGVERLIESWAADLPQAQAEEVWRQWNSIAGQRIFKIHSLRELEEVFLSTQSGLLFRLLNQFKSSNVFCEGEHQASIDFMQELKLAQSEGKLLAFDLSSVSVEFHPWIWQLLNQALRHSMWPLSEIWVGTISRQEAWPDAVDHEINQLLEQGVNVLALHPLRDGGTVSSILVEKKAYRQHVLQVKVSQSSALFLSNLSLGIPLLFGDFSAISVNASPACFPQSAPPEQDASSLTFQAIEPPSIQPATEALKVPFLDALQEEIPVSVVPSLPDLEAGLSVTTSSMASVAEDASHAYSSILGELPEDWGPLTETSCLNPAEHQPPLGVLDPAEKVESPHHIHPCLPDSMLEEVTPYLDPTADSGFDDPEKVSLHVEYIIDGKEEFKRKPESTVEEWQQDLMQSELLFGENFDPYYVAPTAEPDHESRVFNPIPSSLVGPILGPPGLEKLTDLSLKGSFQSPVELSSNALTFHSSVDESAIALDSSEALAFEESLEFESEGFYDDLLKDSILEAHVPPASEALLSTAFVSNDPTPFDSEAQLEALTTVFDAVQTGKVSLPVQQSVEVDRLSLEDLDHFDFDLNIINQAMQTEFNEAGRHTPVFPNDFLPDEAIHAQAPEPCEGPLLDPEDPLAGFSFEMPRHSTPIIEEQPSVVEEEPQPEGLPEFLVPVYDEGSFAEDDLIQSFQADVAELDSGYVPLQAHPLNQTTPMKTLVTASQPAAITPPHSLDAVPVSHTPVYKYQEPPSSTTTEITPKAGVAYSPGMRVRHDVYGEGVVHSVVEIENRRVLSIVFEKAGKRLIDPTLTVVFPL